MGGALGVAFGIGLLGEAAGDALLPGARRVWMLTGVLHVLVLIPMIVMHVRPRHGRDARVVAHTREELLDGR